MKRIIILSVCLMLLVSMYACRRSDTEAQSSPEPEPEQTEDITTPEQETTPEITPVPPSPTKKPAAKNTPSPTPEPTPEPTKTPEPTVTIAPTPLPPPRDIKYYETLWDARRILDYSFMFPASWPEDFTRKSIGVVEGTMAEIVYAKGTETIVYRVRYGSSNISGDYINYSSVKTEDINGRNTVIKSEGDLTYLLLWEFDGYSYSLRAGGGLSETAMKNIAASA